tara:strand:+ start:892 stop:1086 length:195 start_codon:yes stop_codon:yes gene_type:complete
MSSTLLNWFEQAKGARLEDPNSGDIFTLIDLRRVGSEAYFGLLPIGGPVVYVNIDRYDELISIA